MHQGVFCVVDRVLIETLWNVKRNNTLQGFLQGFVLIETLWNVKIFASFITAFHFLVLIETLWNVKHTAL